MAAGAVVVIAVLEKKLADNSIIGIAAALSIVLRLALPFVALGSAIFDFTLRGVFMISEWLEKQRAKAALLQVFKSGNIGVTYSYGNGKTNGMVYPQVRTVQFDYKNKAVLYTFSLPVGMDPKEIKKKEYCFQQVFGQNIKLKGEIKEFKLIVYTTTLSSEHKYDYQQNVPSFENMALSIVAGIDLNGNIIVFDLLKNPHLLIAGETGSGKSTQLRSILPPLFKRYRPIV